MNTKEVTILLVDDDELDVEFAIRSFRKGKLSNPIVVAENGQEALDMLRGENGHAPLNRPS